MMFQELMQAGVQERLREAEAIALQTRARALQRPELNRPRSGASQKRSDRLPVLTLLPRKTS
jgi:hypothetical protein